METKLTAQGFLEDAHRNGHRGPVLLKRWAMVRNMDGNRRRQGLVATTPVLEEAIELEKEGEK